MRERSQSGDLQPNDPSNHGASNAQASSSKSGSSQNLQTDDSSPSKLNQFFDSYVPNPNSAENDAESVCSDSVSKYDGNGGREGRRSDNHRVQICAPANNSGQWHDPGAQRLRSDSSSLATLVSERRISDSRRTFCLFVTFDLILTTILWLIMCGTSSDGKTSFIDVVILQMKNYTLKTSMFDVVCLAAVRFAFLEISYALLWIKHWWPVAVSTSISDILLILKIFPIFQNTAAYAPKAIPMTVVILLTNFILTWIEVWFIDFKVLPEEARLAHRTVRQFIRSQGRHRDVYGLSDDDENTPLVQNNRRRYTPPASSFYTVAPSDRLSYHTVFDSEFSGPVTNHQRGSVFPAQISPEDMIYVERGKDALNKLWNSFNDRSMWKVDKQLDNGDMLYTADVPTYGKTFRIDATIHGVTAQHIFQEIILKAESMPSWNKTVSDVKILKRIGEQTAISIEVSAPAAKGMIQSRDFVTVRRVDVINKSYISAGISTDFHIPDTGRIRGLNGPTGFIVTPCEGEFSSAKFTWILNTNLKGSLPQYLVHRNLAATLVSFISSMKAYLGVEE